MTEVRVLNTIGCEVVHDKESGLLVIIYDEQMSPEVIEEAKLMAAGHAIALGGVDHIPYEGEVI